MATVESNYEETEMKEVAGVRELLTDLWFTLATISGVIHLHLAAGKFRAALDGEASMIVAILSLGVVAATAGLLVAYELDRLPQETIYLLGMGLAGFLLVAYIDFTALGLVAPLFGVETPQAREPVIIIGYLYVDLVAEANVLALTSKIAELATIATLGVLYAAERGLLPIDGDTHVANAAADAGTGGDAHEQQESPENLSGQKRHSTDGGHVRGGGAPKYAPPSDTPQQGRRASRQHEQVERNAPAGQPSGHRNPNPSANAGGTAGANAHRQGATPSGANAGAGAHRQGAPQPGANGGAHHQGSAPPGANGGAHRRGVAQPGANANHQPASTDERTQNDVSFLERFGHPDSWGLLVMRLSLAMVFIVFGGIKVWPASPAAAVVEQTVFFFPFREFFFVLGVWEFIVGVALLWKRTLRFAAWLFFFQMAGTLLGLVWFIEGTWYIFPIYPTAVGTYIIKNFIFLGAAMVLVIGYTGSTVREPPLDRLENETMKRIAKKTHWVLSTWVPRHSLSFLRGTVVFLLIAFGIKGLVGLGATGTLENIQFALNQLGFGLSLGLVAFIIGGLKFTSGVFLLSNDQDHMTLSVIALGAYIAIGLTPMILAPQRAFFQGWLVAPAFPTLWFLKDTVTLGAIWVIRDIGHSWDLTRTVGATRDAMQVLLTWMGLDVDDSEPAGGQSSAR